MGTIAGSIKLTDGMSPVLKSMLNSMNLMVSTFDKIDSASSKCIDTKSLAAAKNELARAGAAYSQIGKNINEATANQAKFNSSVASGSGNVDGLMSKVKGLAITIGAVLGGGKMLEMSDAYTNTISRLNLMNDGLQTTDQLQNDILASANRARAEYQSMGDMVGKLGIMAGGAFESSEQIVYFAELLQKNYKIAGTSASEAASATQQLTQALASGVLRGDELNSVMENAPTVIQAIEKYLGVDIAQIRKLAEAGELTADVVTKAMFASAQDTEAAFAALKPTFSDVWVVFKNKAGEAWESVNRNLNKVANSQGVTIFLDNVVKGIGNLTPVIANVIDGFVTFANNPQVQDFLNGIIQGLTDIIAFLIDGASKAAEFIGGFLGVDGVADSLGLIAGGFIAIKAATAGIAGFTAMTKLAETLGIITASTAGGEAAATGLGAVFAGISAPVVAVVVAIGALIATLVVAWNASETFRNAVGTAFETLGKTCSDAVGRIQSAFSPIFGTMSGFGASAMPIFEQIGNVLGNYVVPAITWFLDKFIYAMSNIIAALAPLASAVGNVFSFIGNIIGMVCAILNGDWAAAWQMAKDALANAGMFFINILYAAVGTIYTILTMMFTSIGEIFSAIWGVIVNIGQSITQAGQDAFQWMIDGVIEILANMAGVTVEGFKGAIDYMVSLPAKFFQMGCDIINDLINGIKNTAGNAVAAVGDMVNQIVDKFKAGFGINSPSKVLYEIGTFLMQGLINSVLDSDIMTFFNGIIEDIKAAFAGGNFGIKTFIDFVGGGAAEFLKSIGVGGAAFGDLVTPVTGGVTSGFGYRDAFMTDSGQMSSSYHEGIDIGAGFGAPVGAAGAGEVIMAGWNGGYGNTVKIDHGNGLVSMYAHLDSIAVSVGAMVSKMQTIGAVGSTGNSTGAHLHFGLYQDGAAIDPSALFGFSVGTRYLPNDMVIQAHKGEAIIPANQNPYKNSKGAILPVGKAESLRGAVGRDGRGRSTVNPSISVKMDNHINSRLDIDAIIRELEQKLEEQLLTSAAGVY